MTKREKRTKQSNYDQMQEKISPTSSMAAETGRRKPYHLLYAETHVKQEIQKKERSNDSESIIIDRMEENGV